VTFFESLLALLLAAIVLLQVARRLSLPYPPMLALAGVVVAFVPGAPAIVLDPRTALALFIAPILLDAAFDFPAKVVWKLWRPLVLLALVAVLVSTAVVAWIGWQFAGLPIAAAVVLGAIVAPPDAAAATAVLSSVSLPRRTVAVLKGESLFNDASALLLFSGALAVQASGGFTGGVALQLTLAVPGGLLLGIAFGLLSRRINRYVAGTLGGTLLQFVDAFLVWIVAEHLHLSAVLAVVACAMTVARAPDVIGSPRERVHSYAVWSTVVFLLNVLAFLLMGMQARTIVSRMPTNRLYEALGVAAMVVVAVIVTRFVVVMAWNRLSRSIESLRDESKPPTVAQGLIVSWAGMRGLLTLATAFALPNDFPQRDVVVLIAFSVVLATLVFQGLTLTPLIKLLKLDALEDPARQLTKARAAIAKTGRDALAGKEGREAQNLRDGYDIDCGDDTRQRYRVLGLEAVRAERTHLIEMRDDHRIGVETYQILEEELDWREITLLPDEERQIEEG
jgi:Na+/H+ antiporter